MILYQYKKEFIEMFDFLIKSTINSEYIVKSFKINKEIITFHIILRPFILNINKDATYLCNKTIYEKRFITCYKKRIDSSLNKVFYDYCEYSKEINIELLLKKNEIMFDIIKITDILKIEKLNFENFLKQ